MVAETPYEFPDQQSVFVHSPAEVMERYIKVSWREHFQRSEIEPERLLKAIRQYDGSIGRSTANSLHMTMAELRRWIEWLWLQETVNQIRKKHGRRPVQFLDQDEFAGTIPFRIYELRLPARF